MAELPGQGWDRGSGSRLELTRNKGGGENLKLFFVSQKPILADVQHPRHPLIPQLYGFVASTILHFPADTDIHTLP